MTKESTFEDVTPAFNPPVSEPPDDVVTPSSATPATIPASISMISPTLSIDARWVIGVDVVAPSVTFTTPAFSNWAGESPTLYQMQPIGDPANPTAMSRFETDASLVGYPGDTMILMELIDSNTNIRWTLTDNTEPNIRQYKFYLAAKNTWAVGISDLITLTVSDCPYNGGATITHPSDPIMTSVGLNEANANAAFGAATITELISGCGVFSHYAISGDAATMAKLQYPTPWKDFAADCVGNINTCKNIRVLDTSVAETLTFTLEAYPHVFQAPHSVTMTIVIDSDPCSIATVQVSANPADLVISKSATPGNVMAYALEPDYNALMTSSTASTCPIDTLAL
jgi:hypothetical protein